MKSKNESKGRQKKKTKNAGKRKEKNRASNVYTGASPNILRCHITTLHYVATTQGWKGGFLIFF
jgi:hypothetical protein